jgi:hypothetical protein
MVRYRIIDSLHAIVANSLTLEQAHETLSFLELDNPHERYEIESYTPPVAWRLGRDPDLH